MPSTSLSPYLLEMLRLCVWLFLLLLIFVPLERVWSLRRQKLVRAAFGTDLVYYFLSGFVPKLLLAVPLTLVAAILHRVVPTAFYESLAGISPWLRIPAALIVAEIGSYWGHRWSHEIPFLWRFHAIHHSAEEIDWLVNTKAHPFDIFFVRFCGLLPMYLLGLAQPSGTSLDLGPLLVTVLGTAWGFFIHANVTWRFGWLEYLVATPAFHHWHHTNDSPAVINKNYAAMLPSVDRLFGTFYLPEHKWPGKYGTDTAIPKDLPRQLVSPMFANWEHGEDPAGKTSRLPASL